MTPLLSADLIMLGLATHEPNFTIIREEFKPNKPRPCALCGQLGHEIKDCQGTAREKQGEVSAAPSALPALRHNIQKGSVSETPWLLFVFQHDQFADSMPVSEQEFIFIRLCVLREVRCSLRCSSRAGRPGGEVFIQSFLFNVMPAVFSTWPES